MEMLNTSTFAWEKMFGGEKVKAGEQLSGYLGSFV